MEKHNKTYGFTIAVKELKETVPNIFRYASAYMRKNNLKSKGLWEMFIEPLDDYGKPAPKKEKAERPEGSEAAPAPAVAEAAEAAPPVA